MHAWPATNRPADRGPRPSDGQGARPMGLRADLRRAAQARDPGGGHNHQDAAATPRHRSGAPTRRADLGAVLASPGRGIVACDFFMVETIRLQTLYVLAFIQLSTRRVVAAGVTAHPDTAWVTSRPGTRRWISTIAAWQSGSCSATTTPSSLAASTTWSVAREGRCSARRSGRRRRTPLLSGGSERYVRSVWTGRWCLAGAICCGCCAATSPLHAQRPHRSLALAVPELQSREQRSLQVNPRGVRRRDVLGGLIHEYHGDAA
jgi:hypothetical protein